MAERELTFKTRGSKGWFHADGRYVPVENFSREKHHANAVVDNPEAFGMSHEELSKVETPEKIALIKDGYAFHSDKLNEHVGNKGWFRFANNSTLGRYSMRRNPDGSNAAPDAWHTFTLNNHGKHTDSTLEDLKVPLRMIHQHLSEVAKPNDHISVHVESGDSPQNMYTNRFSNLHHLGNFLGIQTKNDSRERVDATPETSSTQIRAAMGTTAPMGVPTAIWNNMRKIGDSYGYGKKFKDILTEVREHAYDPDLTTQIRMRRAKSRRYNTIFRSLEGLSDKLPNR